MFKVSTLLLDDAFKPTTPLTNDVISEMLRQFVPLSDISQGSVATHLRCGGIFSDGIITNISTDADVPCDTALCKIDSVTLHSEYNYQAMSIGR